MPTSLSWRMVDRILTLDKPLIMGILNTTPDSFSDGGRFVDTADAVAHGLRLVHDGADIVDVGGESTRPGADPVGVDQEIDRVSSVVRALAAENVIVSIDTMKPEVAAAALAAGAVIVNDVSGFETPEMRRVAAESGAGLVVMHMKGRPRTMQDDPTYDDVVVEVGDHLTSRVAALIDAGCDPAVVAVDPGIGFGKTLAHNLELMDRLDEIADLGWPVVLGTSRKAFLGAITGRQPSERDAATAVTVALGVAKGVSVFRVHDPVSAKEAAAVAWAIVRRSAPYRDKT